MNRRKLSFEVIFILQLKSSIATVENNTVRWGKSKQRSPDFFTFSCNLGVNNNLLLTLPRCMQVHISLKGGKI